MNRKKAKLDHSSDIMSHPMTSHPGNYKEEAVFSSKPISFSSRDMSRLMLRTLYNLDLKETALKLEEESGLTVATEAAEQLFSSIRLGQWYRAAEVARELSFSSISSEDAVSMLLEIKYFELVDSGSIDEALVCLRGELSEHIADRNRLSHLSTFLLASNKEDYAANCSHIFLRSRETVVKCLRSHLSPEEVVGDYRLERLIGDALRWQSRGHTHSSSLHGCPTRLPSLAPCSLLSDISTRPIATAIPTTAVVELRYQCEVWCVAFSPNGKFLATACADGSVEVWLLTQEDENGCSFSEVSVKCRGAGKAPLLLRWDSSSSSIVCCCQDSSVFYGWKVTPVMASRDPSLGRCCREYDQKFNVVFADFLPSFMRQDVLITCTKENHIFICDLENNPLSSHVGSGGKVSCAVMILPEKRDSDTRIAAQKQEQDCWVPCQQKPSSSIDPGGLNNAPADKLLLTSKYKLLVANARGDEVTLFYISISCKPQDEGQSVYEIVPAASLFAGAPVVSLAACVRCCEDLPGHADPLALMTLFGGAILTVMISQNEKGPQLFVGKNNSKCVLQSRFVVKPNDDPSGRYTACGGEDGTVRIWQHQLPSSRGRRGRVAAAPPTVVLTGHSGHVGEVCWNWSSFSGPGPDPGPILLLASASDDCTVRVWVAAEYPHRRTPIVIETHEEDEQKVQNSSLGEQSLQALLCGEGE